MSREAVAAVLAPVARLGWATVPTSLSRVAAHNLTKPLRGLKILQQLAPRSRDRG